MFSTRSPLPLFSGTSTPCPHNRLGFAIQLALVRDLGRPLRAGEAPPEAVVSVVADQLGIDPAVFALYAQREETRREHARKIIASLNLQPVRKNDYRTLITAAAQEAAATEQSKPITKAVVEALKDRKLLIDRSGERSHLGWIAEAPECAKLKNLKALIAHFEVFRSPFSRMIQASESEAPYVLGGLLHKKSSIEIHEHATDTASAMETTFSMFHAFGYRLIPRIRNLGNRKLFVIDPDAAYEPLGALIAGAVNMKIIEQHWDEVLRLKALIGAGLVPLCVILKKLAASPRQNRLNQALREMGRIVNAIILWNTFYLSCAVEYVRGQRVDTPDELLSQVAPLPWAHIALTGDYLWNEIDRPLEHFRPIRTNRFNPNNFKFP